MLPDVPGRAFVDRWVGLTAASMSAELDDQLALNRLIDASRVNESSPSGLFFAMCTSLDSCRERAAEIKAAGGDLTLVRLTVSLIDAEFGVCAAAHPANLTTLPPCAQPYPYIHPLCGAGKDSKAAALAAAGFWVVERGEGCRGGAAADGLPRCAPAGWRGEQQALAFEACDSRRPLLRFSQQQFDGLYKIKAPMIAA